MLEQSANKWSSGVCDSTCVGDPVVGDAVVVSADVEFTVSAGSKVVGADVDSTVVGADVVPEACNTP